MTKLPTGMKLKENETILRYTKRSWRSFSLWILFALIWFILGLFSPFLLLMAIGLIVIIIMKRMSSEYAVTTDRIYCRKGFTMGRSIEEIDLKDIHGIDVSQNLFSQSIDVGELKVRMLDPDEYVTLEGIKDPEGWKDYVEKVKDNRGALKHKVLRTKGPDE